LSLSTFTKQLSQHWTHTLLCHCRVSRSATITDLIVTPAVSAIA